MEINKIYNEDCLEGMKRIADGSIDMILCDLPYKITRLKWDIMIPFEPLWEQYKRVIKPNGAIVLTASQPFTSALVMSNPKMFKYCWYWNKQAVTGFANAKKQPLRCIEDILIFYTKPPVYNPQGLVYKPTIQKNGRSVGGDTIRGDIAKSSGRGSLRTAGHQYIQEYTNYPRNLLEIKRDKSKLHPTQKPVALFEYLIKTYTNAGELVLDNCMGSGTTAIACMNTGRDFIGFEVDKGYYDTACKRIEDHKEKTNAFNID